MTLVARVARLLGAITRRIFQRKCSPQQLTSLGSRSDASPAVTSIRFFSQALWSFALLGHSFVFAAVLATLSNAAW
jgi:hypothetical protein